MRVVNTNKNYWKHLTKQFNEHASKDDWKKPRSIKVSHTSLFPNHVVGRGPNGGEATLLDFSTRLIEARAIHIHYERKYESLEVYFAAANETPTKVFFEVRKNNKTLDFTYNKHLAGEDQFSWFVRDLIAKIKAAGNYVDAEEIEKQLIADGYTILHAFEFSDCINFRMPHNGGHSIHPKYVKRIKNGVEIGWMAVGTYNSIPNVLRIECVRGIKTQSLAELGIETSGYYDHHYKCEILPSQAKEAKAFFSKRFKNRK